MKRSLDLIVTGLLVGLLTGIVITLFAEVIALSGEFFSEHPFLIIILPSAAALTLHLYKLTDIKSKNSTSFAIDDINRRGDNLAKSHMNRAISPRMGLLALVTAAMTHISGAAGGKEGAGVQIGFAAASFVDKIEDGILKAASKERVTDSSYNLMCGAAAAFSALFASPIAGILFGTQLASPKTNRYDAYLPCLFSSYSAFLISRQLGIHTLYTPVAMPLPLTLNNTLLVLAFAALIGLYARLFCYMIHEAKKIFSKIASKNDYLSVATPAFILMALSFAMYKVTGTFKYNGLGGQLLADMIGGDADLFDSFVKLIFIALTFSAGFSGGEVVPLIIVGAGAGMAFANVFSLPVPAYAVLGGLGMLSGGTNLPLACFALGLEKFMYQEPVLLFLATTVSFVTSGTAGIYHTQENPY